MKMDRQLQMMSHVLRRAMGETQPTMVELSLLVSDCARAAFNKVAHIKSRDENMTAQRSKESLTRNIPTAAEETSGASDSLITIENGEGD